MPYKIGKKTGKGWQILKNEKGKWKVIAHSDSKKSGSKYSNKTCWKA